jgi:glycosyltransferase involved in cell wall biosynthesis
MRIALVSREFAPFQGWGAGTYASLAAGALAEAGHEVHVLTGDPRALHEGPKLRPGVQFHVVDLEKPFPASMAGLPCFAAGPQRYAWGVWETLRSLHEKHQFEIIEFPDFLGEAYFCIRGKRTLGVFADALLCVRAHMTIGLIRSINQDDWLDQERVTVEHMEQWSLAHADAVVAPCEDLSSIIVERLKFWGNTPKRLPPHLVLPYPIPVEQQRREMDYREPREGDGPTVPTIVYCGRYERRKGVHVLVQAAQQLMREGVAPGLTVRLIGDDTNTGPLQTSYRAWLESMIAPEHRDAFRFVPRASRVQLGAIYRGATVVCVPSLWENFPFACTEAMLMGACVVGTRQGGMREIIENGVSGLVAESQTPEGLAWCLRKVLTDASLRASMAARAPERIAKVCDPKRVCERFIAFAQKLREENERERQRTRSDSSVVCISPGSSEPPAPLVSVIVPVYNLHQYLPDTLRSIREQKASPSLSASPTAIETIIVDDGSTDPATIAAIDALERAGDASLRVVRIAHAGLSAARNAGVDAAKGRYVLPLDADDMLAPGAIEKLVAAAERNPEASFITAPLRSFSELPEKPVAGWIPLGGDDELMYVMNGASSCVALMQRERVEYAGGYNTSFPAYEDWDLYCRLIKQFAPGEVIPEFLVLHRLRGESMMHTLSRKRHHLLRARIAAQYSHLSSNPGRSIRFMLGDSVNLDQLDAAVADHASVERRARELIQQNVRYRWADAINRTLKRLGVHAVLKRVLARR